MTAAGGRAGRTRQVYILAGEFSAPRDASPVKVFRPFKDRAGLGSLDEMMFAACERAIHSLGGPSAAARITHLLGITFPGEQFFSTDVLNRFYDLKRRLGIHERCQVRFEIGSSDAGAVLFASALHQLRGLDGPGTALVAAGQYIDPDADAINVVAHVVEREERELGMNMVAVGDMLLDQLAWRWRTEGRAPSSPHTDEEFEDFLDRWMDLKLELADEYPAAQRSLRDRTQKPSWNRPMCRWMGHQHMAYLSKGACAVVITTDRALVDEWIARERSHGRRPRLVRVLGVGEGDARGVLTRRGEPLIYFKAMRQALSELRRATGTNLDYLRASAFMVLHDAFPSIEMGFLHSLGFAPVDVEQRALTWWPNPYGGLLAFGHALAASGLVQISRAFHAFTRPAEYTPRAEGKALHPDFARVDEPLHCVTTSVGGPMTHVVATLLDAVPVSDGASALDDETDDVFTPRTNFQPEPFDSETFEEKTRWVERMQRLYRDGLDHDDISTHLGGLRYGVLEARTSLALARLPRALLPLPEVFIARWSPPPLRHRGWTVALSAELAAVARQFFASERTPRDDAAGPFQALSSRVREEARALAPKHPRAPAGVPEKVLLDELEHAVWHALRLPVGYVVGSLPASARVTPAHDEVSHRLCLLTDDVVSCEIGALLRLQEHFTDPDQRRAHPMPVALAEDLSRPGLVPPWYIDPTRVMRASSLAAPPLEDIVCSLRRDGITHATLVRLRELAERVARELLRDGREPAPVGLVRLFHELVLNPDEDRARILAALESWAATGRRDAPEDFTTTIGYCVFDVVGAGRRRTRELMDTLETVARAIRRAQGWLCGAQAVHERLGDSFALTVLDRRLEVEDETAWVPLVRFARDVYQSCLREGVRVRAAVCIDEGAQFRGVGARRGVVGAVQLAADRVMREPVFAEESAEDGEARWDGVALVIPERRLAAIAGGNGGDPFEVIWARVGGEVFGVVSARETFALDAKDSRRPRFHAEIRRRERPEVAGRIESIVPSMVLDE